MNSKTEQTPAQPEAGRSLATVSEVMAYARVGRSTVYRAVQRGDLRAFQSGRILRIDMASVHRWLKPVPAGGQA